MSRKPELLPRPITSSKGMNEGYITDMLRELAIQARSKNAELAYFIEMALACSVDFDRTEKLRRRENTVTSA